MANIQIIHFKTIKGSSVSKDSGFLSFFESDLEVPFSIKRVYYIYGTKSGEKRGYHAHKNLKQVIFCPYGKVELYLEDEFGKSRIILDKPNVGVIIDHLVWREIKWIVNNSVLLVACSEHYSEDDYLRDYQDFKRIIDKKKS